MARLYGIRPSALLQGSLTDLNIDVAFGMALIAELDQEFDRATSRKGLGSDIAAAVRAAVNTER